MRIFVIVAKHRADLYEYFRRGFAGVDAIEVMLDRRIGSDDAVHALRASQHGERRASDVYDELGQRGFVIVRVPT